MPCSTWPDLPPTPARNPTAAGGRGAGDGGRGAGGGRAAGGRTLELPATALAVTASTAPDPGAGLSRWTADYVAGGALSADPATGGPAAGTLTAASGGYARDLRLQLSNEHLGVELDPAASPADAYDAFWRSASDLDAWHANGRRGPRPPGQLRHYHAPELTRWQRAISRPLYRFVYDPDGRPAAMRRRGEF